MHSGSRLNTLASWHHHAATFTEADAGRTLGFAPATDDHFVTVGEELPLRAVAQSDRVLTTPGPLQQATTRVLGGA